MASISTAPHRSAPSQYTRPRPYSVTHLRALRVQTFQGQKTMKPSHLPSIALIPCAGKAARLGNPSRSKELLRVSELLPGRPYAPGIETLLDLTLQNCSAAGIRRAVIPIRSCKQDLADTLGEDKRFDVCLSVVSIQRTDSVLETVEAALPCISGQHTLLVFPDILFLPANAITQAMDAYAGSTADIFLGLIPTDRPDKCDMVSVDPTGRIQDIFIKDPGAGHLRFGWSFAIWSPSFTQFCAAELERKRTQEPENAHIGDLIRAAIQQGPAVDSITFPNGIQLDLGTWEDLKRAPAIFSSA